MKTTRIIITTLAMLALASTAYAQSTVTGTLSSGASSGSSLSGTVTPSSSTLSGTVSPSTNTLTGTVTSPSTGSSGGGGGGGGGGNSNPVDICPNLDGVQSTLPSGYGLQNGTCVALSGTGTGGGTSGGGTGGGGVVLGTTTGTPNVPNTGAGGDAATTLALLGVSAIAAAAGARYLIKQRATE